MRFYLQEAGGAFIKIGQILALRYEILPPQYCWELSELFDNVTPMPLEQIKLIVGEEFDKQTFEIFTLFEEEPIASASFAQVHKAVLPDGKHVAVKIQRPGLPERVRMDFSFLMFVAALASPFLRIKALKVHDVLEELRETTIKELDFRLEKDNAELIRENIDDKSLFFVPKTHTEYTTERVLVQDFVEGIKLNDILRAKQGRVDPKQFELINSDLDKIALDLIAELGRQYFMVGIYHSDPHPGNIIITPDNKIAFVDFGIVGHVSKYSRALFWNFIRHIVVDVDAKKAANAFLRLGLRPIEDKITFLAQDRAAPKEIFLRIVDELAGLYERSLHQIMDSWAQAIGNPAVSLYDRSTAVAFIKAMRFAEQYNVHFQRDIILFIRTLVIGDMLAMQISPTFKMKRALQNFAESHKDVTDDLENYLPEHNELVDQELTDPWNEDMREKARDYIVSWFQSMIENRPALYQKIKQPVESLKRAL